RARRRSVLSDRGRRAPPPALPAAVRSQRPRPLRRGDRRADRRNAGRSAGFEQRRRVRVDRRCGPAGRPRPPGGSAASSLRCVTSHQNFTIDLKSAWSYQLVLPAMDNLAEIELEPSITAIDAVFEKLLADIVR